MSHNVPSELKYTKEHEWIKIDGDTVTIGITDFAQSQLGDIVFVELPESGTTLDSGATFGVVESIKSVSDLYAPISGEVLEKNGELEDQPELINSDAYAAWMLKVKVVDTSQLEQLLSSEQYQNICVES